MKAMSPSLLTIGSFESPLGTLFAARSEKGLCFLSMAPLAEALQELKKKFPSAPFKDASFTYESLQKLPLDLHGTPFQKKVWNALLAIPRGQTSTYGALAKQIGHPKAVRAVGTAVGANPVCVLVPCHRVLPSTGKVGKYRWGSEKKRTLLEQEKTQFKS